MQNQKVNMMAILRDNASKIDTKLQELEVVENELELNNNKIQNHS